MIVRFKPHQPQSYFFVDTKGEAQRLFRHISNIMIIPSEVYNRNQKEIDDAIADLSCSNRVSKLNSLYTIRRKSVAVPYYYLKDIRYWLLNSDYEIIVADMKYSFETGIELASVLSATFI